MNALINVLAWPFGWRRVVVAEQRPIPGDIVGRWLVAMGDITPEEYRCRPVAIGHRWERR